MNRRYRLLYLLGIAPWDRADIPTPLTALVEGPDALPPGRAVDLGCGTGRQARYLAAHGWSVTAIDYVPTAIAAARLEDKNNVVTWRVADVTDPAAVDPAGTLAGSVTLLLDNGCLHGIELERRQGWASTVTALAAPNSTLLVRAAPRRRRGIGPRGIGETDLATLLGHNWRRQPSTSPGWYPYHRVG